MGSFIAFYMANEIRNLVTCSGKFKLKDASCVEQTINMNFFIIFFLVSTVQWEAWYLRINSFSFHHCCLQVFCMVWVNMLIHCYLVSSGLEQHCLPETRELLRYSNLCSIKYNISWFVVINQLRYFKIQLKTIDITTRLQELNPTNSIVYSLEPCAEVYCLKLNINISKLGYCALPMISSTWSPAQ